MSSLYTMQGPSKASLDNILSIDPRDLTPEHAGFHFLALVAKMYPGITFAEMMRLNHSEPQMSGLFDFLGRQVKTVVGAVKDTVNYVGDKTGSIVRLASSPKVLTAVEKAAAAVATGGASTVASGVFGGGSTSASPSSSSSSDLLSDIGAAWQKMFGQAQGTQAASAQGTSMASKVVLGFVGVVSVVAGLKYLLKGK